MTVTVHRVAVSVGEIVPVDVVDVSVSIVVEPVTGDLTGVGPHVSGEVRVGIVDARVDHGDDHVGRTGRQVPGLGRVDIRISGPTGLAGVVHSPEPIEAAVVRCG